MKRDNRQRISSGNASAPGAWMAGVFLFCVAVYAGFLAPDVGWGDGADFVLSAHYLGVAHPTGYPLITLAGKLFSFVPAGTLAFRFALLSALAGAAAASVFFYLAHRVSGRLVVSAYATIIFCLSTFMWKQAISIEVYTINLFFCLCMLAVLDWFAPGGGAKKVLGMVLVACIGLGNHGTLVLPALLLGVLALAMKRKHILTIITGGAFLVLLGFTLYACLPLFSARTDLFDWNAPVTPFDLWLLLSGLDFWVIGEYNPVIMWRNTQLLAGSIFVQAWPLLAAAFFVALAMKLKPRVKITLAGVFVLSTLFPILYPTHEKEAFFLIAFSMIMLLAAGGLAVVMEKVEASGGGAKTVAVAVLAALIVGQGGYLAVRNLRGGVAENKTDRSALAYTEMILKSAPRDALLFIDHVADDTIAPPLYYQFTEGKRKDVFLFYRLYLAFPWWRDSMRARAAETGAVIIVPDIDIEAEKEKSYKISKEEYERLQEGKTLNTVSIDIQTKKIIKANEQQLPIRINTPARFRKSVISEDIYIKPDGFLFAMGGADDLKLSGLPGEAPAPLGGIFDSVVFDYYSELAYSEHLSGDAAGFVEMLETALGYEKHGWVYGELCGALKQMGRAADAEKYCNMHRHEGADFLNDLY